MRSTAILIILFISTGLLAQEDHYWNNHIGAKSALTGGSVTASVRDNSAIYYNPGALGFLERSNISVTASAYTYQNEFMENAVGEGYNLFNDKIATSPQFISGVLKVPKMEHLTFVFAGFNTLNQSTRYVYRNNMLYDVLPTEGNERYLGRFDYQSTIREDWAGIGMALQSWEHSSIGISAFAVFRKLETSHMVDAQAYNADNNNQLLASSSLNRMVDLFMVTNIWKFGYAYQNDWIRLGASLTAPGIPLKLFSTGRLNWKEQKQLGTSGSNNTLVDAYEKGVKPNYRYPLNVDLGTQFLVRNNVLSLRLSWYTGIGDYRLASFTENADYVSNTNSAMPEQVKSVWYNARNMVNVGVGMERKLNEQINLLVGFNTNNNAVDKSGLIDEDKWVPTVSYWALYNFGAGIELKTRSADDLVVGVNVGFTRRKNDMQIVNLSKPTSDTDNFLLGERTNNVNTQIMNIGIVLGYTFNFKTKLERDLLDETRKRIKK